MPKVLREAALYRETGKTNSAGARILTRGKTNRQPNAELRKQSIDILAGHVWVSNLPDLTRWNEAYLEVTVTTLKGNLRIPYAFKLEIDVKDESFSANIQGAEIITNAQVIGNGVEFQCALTEQDKIDPEQFRLVKEFVENNDIPGVSQALISAASVATLPINPKEVISIFFNTVELIDELNEDERIWSERPKLDLRAKSNNPLYEGWYALVSTPKKGKKGLPTRLYEAGGYLYKTFESEDDNEPFEEQTYFSWQIMKS